MDGYKPTLYQLMLGSGVQEITFSLSILYSHIVRELIRQVSSNLKVSITLVKNSSL